MTKLRIAAGLAALLLAAPLAAATADFRVNETLVTKARQDALLAHYSRDGQPVTPEAEDMVRLILIRDTVLMDAAVSLKLAGRPDVKARIEEAEAAIAANTEGKASAEEAARLAETARRNILMSTVVNDWLAAHPVTDEDVRAAFEADKAAWGESEYAIRTILVKTEEDAAAVLAELKAGKDFAELAQARSLNADTKAQGGLEPFTSLALMPEAVAAAVGPMTAGQVCGKPVAVGHGGWLIVKLQAKRPAQRFKALELEAPRIKEALTLKKVQQYMRALIEDAKVFPLSAKPRFNR
ncbi:MAG: peptidyl-prolyl cis-trans isomerase [Duodenibacillus sp.]|nr:peptidyl-prolyl cis-trans isomerase [Duodenibacillus sp.]